jgi:Cu(I)/Ag(I) efflux system membrane fusion protein
MKSLYLIGALSVSLSLGACQGGGHENHDHGNTETPAAEVTKKAGNALPAAFNTSYNALLDQYMVLKDALVKTNAVAADSGARAFLATIDGLALTDLQSDSSKMTLVKQDADSLRFYTNQLLAITNDPKCEQKRAAFEKISDKLYADVQALGLKGRTVYRQYCPMAFNDKGAYWLSNDAKVMNPYFGNRMLHCGEVTDTLAYD